jgi:hypothetical protein
MVIFAGAVAKADRLSLWRNASRIASISAAAHELKVAIGSVFDFAAVAKRLPQQIARIGFVTLANMVDVYVAT